MSKSDPFGKAKEFYDTNTRFMTSFWIKKRSVGASILIMWSLPIPGEEQSPHRGQCSGKPLFASKFTDKCRPLKSTTFWLVCASYTRMRFTEESVVTTSHSNDAIGSSPKWESCIRISLILPVIKFQGQISGIIGWRQPTSHWDEFCMSWMGILCFLRTSEAFPILGTMNDEVNHPRQPKSSA